jgi:hypothetical protein
MATEKTFSFVGISKLNGEYKMRFANDLMRIKVLAKNGHEDIRFFPLDEPMQKYDAVRFVQEFEELQDTEAQQVIAEYLVENASRGTSVKAAKPAPVVVAEFENEEEPF